MNTANSTEFIKEFIALVRFIAAGEPNIGFLGKERIEIHRVGGDNIESLGTDEDEMCPPQDAMDEAETECWRKEHTYREIYKLRAAVCPLGDVLGRGSHI